MRGEETQVFGALDDDRAGTRACTADLILPGTHSKWVQVRDGQIVAFRTYLTGELYAVLSAHSILGRLFVHSADTAEPAPSRDTVSDRAGSAHRATAFRDGVARAAADPAGLSALLFSVRAEGLFGTYDGAALPDYLSGLLIGAEIAHARLGLVRAPGAGDPMAVRVIGADPLAARYRTALDQLGIITRDVGATPAASGLFRIARAAGLVHDGVACPRARRGSDDPH
jgi:2-dehydro-3-deoxygalactonokinase